MTSGYTLQPSNCAFCGESLPVPKPGNMKRHPECAIAYAKVYKNPHRYSELRIEKKEPLSEDEIRELKRKYQREYKRKVRSRLVKPILVKNCEYCNKPLNPSDHHSRKFHPECQKEKLLIRMREYARELRWRILDGYGGKCICCGESNYFFLELDHINNDGQYHRKELKLTSGKFYNWIIENNYPNTIQILCSNCNMAKARYGACPHSLV